MPCQSFPIGSMPRETAFRVVNLVADSTGSSCRVDDDGTAIELEAESDVIARVGQSLAKLIECLAPVPVSKSDPPSDERREVVVSADFNGYWGDFLVELIRERILGEGSKDVFFDLRKRTLWVAGTQSQIDRALFSLMLQDQMVNKDYNNAKKRLLKHVANGYTNRTSLLPRMHMSADAFDKLTRRMIVTGLLVKTSKGRATHYRKAGE